MAYKRNDIVTKISDEIIKNVRELEKLEREYNKYTYETKRPDGEEEKQAFLKTIIQKSMEAYNLRHKILFNSQEIDTIQIHDNNVKEILNDIRSDRDKFYSVSAFINISTSLNNDKDDNEKIPTNLCDQLLADDELLLEFHSWFDMVGYYIRRIKVGPIIYTSNLPRNVEKYFSEVRKTYAFGLYKASVIMCRSIIEISLFNKLKRKKLIPDVKNNVTDMKKYFDDKLFELIKIAKYNHIINKQLSDQCHEIKNAANNIIHLKEDEIKLAEDDVLKIIKDTVAVVEYLYK